MMALDAMNISVTEVDLDIDKAEHRAAEIAVMNPLQTLPIFKDRELVLCDSHAISTYLASRYCCMDNILPRDPGGRALVDQLMFYNGGVLHPRYCAAAYPILYENCRFVMPQQLCDIESAYMDLESMLCGRTWFGGSWITLADVALTATVSTMNVLVPIDKKRYPRLSTWLFRMSDEMFYVTANKKGLEEFTKRIDCGRVYDQGEFKRCPRSSCTRRSVAGLHLPEGK
ncbi:glutathione S-transferase 1-like isoform X2 [Epargyreus clarus]